MWDTPRQLLKINGETIVERTIRLLREAGVQNIAISSNTGMFDHLGVPVLKHANSYDAAGYNDCKGHWCDAFFFTGVPTCYLFGDVVYSPKAIRTIVDTETDGIMFFGSAPPFSPQYPKQYAEPFAFKVADQDRLKQAVADVKRLDAEARFRRKPIAWEVWNVISRGPDGDVNTIDYNSYVHINDYTCDIDHPDEVGIFEGITR